MVNKDEYIGLRQLACRNDHHLPPGKGDISAFISASYWKAGTRLSDPGKKQGWVDLVRWLHTKVVYPPKDGHPSQY